MSSSSSGVFWRIHTTIYRLIKCNKHWLCNVAYAWNWNFVLKNMWTMISSCLYFTAMILPCIQFNSTSKRELSLIIWSQMFWQYMSFMSQQWSHVKDIRVCIGCIIVSLLCVKCLCAWRGPRAETLSQTPPAPYSPHPTIPMARPAVFLCCDDRPAFPRRATPQPVPPRSGTRQHFLLSFGAFPHRFEHPSLISGISLWTMRTLSLARSPFLSVLCPLLLSCGFLFIQIFPLFSSPSLSCAFLVFSFSPFSPNSPVGPLFSLSKMPFSSPLPLYPCSWEELETICFIY